MGGIESGGRAQVVAGQIVGISIELLQSACIEPPTQRHSQEAWAWTGTVKAKTAVRKMQIRIDRPPEFASMFVFRSSESSPNADEF